MGILKNNLPVTLLVEIRDFMGYFSFDESFTATLLPVILAACLLILNSLDLRAQVSVTASAGNMGPTSYTTLKASFDAINIGTHQGVITIDLTGSTSETMTASLNASGSGASNYQSILIEPSGGAGRTISGSINGDALITLNGADHVTFDGLNSGGNSLTISNTSTSGAGTATIKFINDASVNTLTRCSILGAAKIDVSSGADGGNIWFAGGAVSTGNDINTVSNCNIGPEPTHLPTRLIWGNGTTTTATLNNSGNIITGNNLFDFFSSNAQSRAIDISSGNTDWTVSNNKIYQTATRTWTTGAEMTCININNTSSGNNFMVSGNTIGTASSSEMGTFTITGGANLFKAIHLQVGASVASSINNNVISAIDQTTTTNGLSSASACILIFPETGLINATGNGIVALSYSSSSSANGDVIGIFNSSSQNSSISNNDIELINVANSSSGSQVFIGILTDLISTATATISGNTIGGTVNAINNTATATGSRVLGIVHKTGHSSITNNTIQNLTMSSGNTGTGSLASVIGIEQSAIEDGQAISQNTIRSLSNTNASAPVVVSGISHSGLTTGSTNVVDRNFIHSLSISSSSGTAQINGIDVSGGMTTYQNNMIRIGINGAGNSITSGALVKGIHETGGTNNFYFNSVYLGGSGVTGSANTFAFQSTVTTNTRIYQNNIFYNARSNGAGTGKHYAISVGGTTPNPAGLTINNNIYLANGTGGTFGFFNSLDVANLAVWKTTVGQDAGSYSSDPQFLLPGGTSATVNLHINPALSTAVEGNGVNIPSITTDFDGDLRASFTPEDIGADAGNFSPSSVIVSATVGVVGPTQYTTLKAAFDEINIGTHQGAITINFTGNTTEPVTATLNASGSGSASYTNILIKPSGGAGRTISGSIAGNALITLNGADNVIIDGLNSGGNSLTISNTSTSSSAGTSTIKFISDATSNTVTRCSVLGSATLNSSDIGNIWFAAGAISTGNDNNTISFCDIGPAGSNLPAQLIWGSGTTTTSTLNNSGILITNNNLFNFFNALGSCRAIDINTGNTDWTVSNNKIYQTATRTWTSVGDMRCVVINTGTSGNNFIVSGNTIGFANSSGTGTFTITGQNNSFKAIELAVGTSVASSITGNTIAGISQTSPIGNIGMSSSCILIFESGGLIITTGNTIGSLTGTGSILFTSTISGGFAEVMGIYNTTSQNSTISNNNIGSFTLSTTFAGGSVVLYCIRTSSTSSTIFANTIGGTTPNSINNTSGTISRVVGILNEFGQSSITNNTIQNLTMAGNNTGTGSSASVIGIAQNAPDAGQIISQNTIRSLSNTNASAAVVVTGINDWGSTTGSANVVDRNFIHSLNVSSSNPNAQIYGIDVTAGVTTYQNNMIRIGIDDTGSSITQGILLNGIHETGGTNNFYFNSVYVGGSGVLGTINTYAFQSTVTSNTRNYRNNIFYNARSDDVFGNGKHYAVRVGGTAPNPPGLTINNNIYLANGVGGTFGFFNGLDVANLTAWQTAVGQDAGSFSSDPQFLLPNGSSSTVDLHINPSIATAVEGNGVNIPAITTDFDGDLRTQFTPEDIGADAGNFTCTNIVTNTNDSGPGSLRSIIPCVGSGSTITFAPALTGQTITLTSGEIVINNDITISGPGMTNLTISGNNASRIFHLLPGINLTINDLSLKNATAVTNGGALLVEGNLTMQNVLLQNNFENGIHKGMTVINPGLATIIGNVDIKN